MTRLILFDIDGTLLNSGGSGSRSLRESVTAVTGRACPPPGDWAGKTDRAIVESLLRTLGVAVTNERIAAVKAAYLARLPENLAHNSRKQLIPGARVFLRQLAAYPGMRMGLQTGNFKQGADIKLRCFGLLGYFDCGGFGDSTCSRTELVRQAIANCEAHCGQRFAHGITLIGDTPADIQAGRNVGALTIAITSGFCSRADLQSARPGIMAKDFTELLNRVDCIVGTKSAS